MNVYCNVCDTRMPLGDQQRGHPVGEAAKSNRLNEIRYRQHIGLFRYRGPNASIRLPLRGTSATGGPGGGNAAPDSR